MGPLASVGAQSYRGLGQQICQTHWVSVPFEEPAVSISSWVSLFHHPASEQWSCLNKDAGGEPRTALPGEGLSLIPDTSIQSGSAIPGPLFGNRQSKAKVAAESEHSQEGLSRPWPHLPSGGPQVRRSNSRRGGPSG